MSKNMRSPALFTASGSVILSFQPGWAISPPRFKPSLLHDSSVILGKCVSSWSQFLSEKMVRAKEFLQVKGRAQGWALSKFSVTVSVKW